MDLLILIPVLFVIVAIIIGSYEQKKLNDIWGNFARENGLRLSPQKFIGYAKVTGMYRNLKYSLYITGSSRAKYTVIDIEMPSATGFALNIYEKNIVVKILKNLGSQNINTGDREFDDTFIIESNNPEKALKILTPELKARLHSAYNAMGDMNISVTGSTVRFQILSILKNVTYLNYISNILLDIGNNVSGRLAEKPQKQLDTSAAQNTCPSCSAEVASDCKFCIMCGRNI